MNWTWIARVLRISGLWALLLLLATGARAAGKPCAMVLMHGKWGSPQNLVFLSRKLEAACDTKLIELPWAQRRGYDQPYEAALASVASQVKALREQGYQRVLVAGHSFGANAAMAYMARVGDADGVIALAPGHSPRSMYDRGIGREAVDKARELVAAGKGDEVLAMEDLNQSQRRSMRMKADVLLSYFDPQGLGDMPTSAAAFKKPVPFLWVVGSSDPLFRAGPDYAFKRAPEHPASKYLEVQAGHADTPDIAVPQVLDWIAALR